MSSWIRIGSRGSGLLVLWSQQEHQAGPPNFASLALRARNMKPGKVASNKMENWDILVLVVFFGQVREAVAFHMIPYGNRGFGAWPKNAPDCSNSQAEAVVIYPNVIMNKQRTWNLTGDLLQPQITVTAKLYFGPSLQRKGIGQIGRAHV